jgi:hypothetical protein
MEAKLRMGLDIVKELAQTINRHVLGSDILMTELGCEHFDESLDMQNTSLLLSAQRKLEDRTAMGKSGFNQPWDFIKSSRWGSAGSPRSRRGFTFISTGRLQPAQ